ncbi:integrin alpha, partial [Singulisphaera rosea]
MRLGNRETRSLVARRREAFRPKFQDLEERTLLSIDLGGVAPPTNPNVATAPYGIELAGGQTNGGAGYSVSDVGDLLNNGYDDFIISAPSITTSSGSLGLGSGTSTVYLVFGSQAVNSSSIQNWLDNTADQRVGDLLQLGSATQANPISGATGFPFAGITITASVQNTSSLGSQLGASVASVGK